MKIDRIICVQASHLVKLSRPVRQAAGIRECHRCGTDVRLGEDGKIMERDNPAAAIWCVGCFRQFQKTHPQVFEKHEHEKEDAP